MYSGRQIPNFTLKTVGAHAREKEDRRFTYNVTLRRALITNVAMEEQ
jgi:hypothetical protein